MVKMSLNDLLSPNRLVGWKSPIDKSPPQHADSGTPITVWTIDGAETPDVAKVLDFAEPFGRCLSWVRCRTIAERWGARLHYLVAFAADEPVGVFPLAELRGHGETRLVGFPESPIGGPIAVHTRAATALRGRAQRLAATRSVSTIQVTRLHPPNALAAPPRAPAWVVVPSTSLAANPNHPAEKPPSLVRMLAALSLRVESVGRARLVSTTGGANALTTARVEHLSRALRDDPRHADHACIGFCAAALTPGAARELLALPGAQVAISELIW